MSSLISNTGPFTASIDGMTISLFAESPLPYTEPPSLDARAALSSFAQIILPPLIVQPSSPTECRVKSQHIVIKNAGTFHTFNANLINHSEVAMYVRGTTKVRVFGMAATVQYNKTVMLKGMEGLHIDVLQTRKTSRAVLGHEGAAIEVDVNVHNKSCVGMEMGPVHVRIYREGVLICQVGTKMHLRPGSNKVTFHGHMNVGNLLKSPRFSISFLKRDLDPDQVVDAHVVGERGEKTAWIDKVVKEMRSPIVMDSTLHDMYNSIK